MNTTLFVINFGVALLGIAMTVAGILAAEGPGPFFGAIVGLPLFALFAGCEWKARTGRNPVYQKRSGLFCIAVGLLLFFGLTCNLIEALVEGWPTGFGWMVMVTGLIAGYFFACGAWRFRRSQSMQSRVSRAGFTSHA